MDVLMRVQNLNVKYRVINEYQKLQFLVLKTKSESCICLQMCCIDVSSNTILLFVVDKIIYGHIKSVCLVSTNNFVKKS